MITVTVMKKQKNKKTPVAIFKTWVGIFRVGIFWGIQYVTNKTRFLRCLCIHIICDALRDLVSFVQFKKCEKHPWRSVAFMKVAGFLSWRCFSRFLNCTNCSKSSKMSHFMWVVY